MKHLNGIDEELTACFLLVAETLKHHKIVAVNMAPASTLAMRLESQKAKEWGGSSRQSHSFNPSHIA